MGQVIHLSGVALAACLVTGCAEGLRSTEAGLPNLAVYQWQQRVLVLDAPSPQDAAYQQQSAWLEAATAGLRDRDLVIVTQPAPAFRIRLIGKDGGVKMDRSSPVDTMTLFSLIDAMPMRQAEMSRRR